MGQHCPQVGAVPLHAPPAVGSRPHQQAGSGSATAQLQRPDSQVQKRPAPHAEALPFVQVAPSTRQAPAGSVGSKGFRSLGQIGSSHTQLVPMQSQFGGGAPTQPGGQVSSRTGADGGQVQVPPVQTGVAKASLPHAETQ